MSSEKYIETIGFMGWDAEQTKKGFFEFLEENREIQLIKKTKYSGNPQAVGKDGTRYLTIMPYSREIAGRTSGHRLDQLILCDDERKMIYAKHAGMIRELYTRFTDQIPDEYKVLFYEY